MLDVKVKHDTLTGKKTKVTKVMNFKLHFF